MVGGGGSILRQRETSFVLKPESCLNDKIGKNNLARNWKYMVYKSPNAHRGLFTLGLLLQKNVIRLENYAVKNSFEELHFLHFILPHISSKTMPFRFVFNNWLTLFYLFNSATFEIFCHIHSKCRLIHPLPCGGNVLEFFLNCAVSARCQLTNICLNCLVLATVDLFVTFIPNKAKYINFHALAVL